MFDALLMLITLSTTFFSSVAPSPYCPCYNIMTCLDSELRALRFGVFSFENNQRYYNNTINDVLSEIEKKLNSSPFEFPPTMERFNVPLCVFPDTQTNRVYKDKVKFLNKMDTDFVTTKKRWENLFDIYVSRLDAILTKLKSIL